MPEICENLLNIYGSESDIDSVLVDLINENDQFSFNVLIPEPPELIDAFENGVDVATQKEFLIRYGVSNLYDWRASNWGTRRDAFNVTIKRINNDHLQIIFSNSWRIPIPWLQVISFKYFDLIFEIYYMEEIDRYGFEVYEDGRVTSTGTEYHHGEYIDWDNSFDLEGPSNNL